MISDDHFSMQTSHITNVYGYDILITMSGKLPKLDQLNFGKNNVDLYYFDPKSTGQILFSFMFDCFEHKITIKSNLSDQAILFAKKKCVLIRQVSSPDIFVLVKIIPPPV